MSRTKNRSESLEEEKCDRIIHNSQKLEVTQVSIKTDEWIKKKVTYMCNTILFNSLKMERSFDTGYNMDKP